MPKRNPLGVPGLREKPAGSGRYVLVLYDPARQPQRKELALKAKSLERARREAEEVRYQYHTRREVDPWTAADDVTIEQAAARHIADHAGQAAHTLANKRSILAAFAAAARARTLRAVTDEDLRRYVEADGRAESSRAQLLTTLSAFFTWAVDVRLADENPVLRYRRLRKRRGGRASYPAPREALLPREYARIEGHLPTGAVPLAVALAQATGLRLGEVVGACRRDVTLRTVETERGPAPISGALRVRAWRDPATGAAFTPKYGRERTVPLTPRAALAAAELLALGERAPFTDDPYAPLLTAPPAGGKPWRRPTKDLLTRAFVAARRAAGFPDSVTFHSTRHSFLTYLALLDLSPYQVKEIAGHADLRTQARYVHARGELLAAEGRGLIADVLGFLCPGVEPERVRREVDAAFDGEGHGYGGPRLRAVLFGGALYFPEGAVSRPAVYEGEPLN